MGKRIISQARGKGGPAYNVRKRAYIYKISYPLPNVEGKGKIIRLINSSGHSAPLAIIGIDTEQKQTAPFKVQSVSDETGFSSVSPNPEQTHDFSRGYKSKGFGDVKSNDVDNLLQDEKGDSQAKERSLKQARGKVQTSESSQSSQKVSNLVIKKKIKFLIPAAQGIYEGKEIWIGKRPEGKKFESGDILRLKDIDQGTKVFNVESIPGKGGKFLRSPGSFGIIMNKDKKVELSIKRRLLNLHGNCRAIIGIVAGDGRKLKPIIKAGKKFYIMKAIGRKWHRTSAVKMNAVDHPFGGGRGKRIKSKIAKRNAPPGAKVGHIRPRRTGRGR